MTKPQRIQLKRTKGWKMPPNTVKVDRSTRWGNPFRVGPLKQYVTWAALDDVPATLHIDPQTAVDAFRNWAEGALDDGPPIPDWTELRGKNLACWCKPGEPCHADVLLEIANADEVPSTNGAVK